MISKRIENAAYRILEDFNITALPIKVDEIAKKLGLDIVAYDLGEHVSGVLHIKKGKGTIGFNPTESKVRRRFTIAHELGHYVLHKNKNEVFVDKQFSVMFRDEKSSTGEIKLEQEANSFAAAILMPRFLVEREVKKMQLDFGDDEDQSLSKLANTFNVSTQAMTFRISNLGLF